MFLMGQTKSVGLGWGSQVMCRGREAGREDRESAASERWAGVSGGHGIGPAWKWPVITFTNKTLTKS